MFFVSFLNSVAAHVLTQFFFKFSAFSELKYKNKELKCKKIYVRVTAYMLYSDSNNNIKKNYVRIAAHILCGFSNNNLIKKYNYVRVAAQTLTMKTEIY